MVLVVLMQRCNFVSAGTESIDSTEATGHFTYRQFTKWLRSWTVIIGGSRPTEVLSKETYLLNIFMVLQFKFKVVDL